ncbi:unnamed protein product [Pleuronectes platessa]|uniref:Uncharacterized protein n=1 Tax=Pleuronectes platessa TaxID=8262 RepID=A0A9N7Z6A7_PLEPL|nr:unnamed protein product [Pleuronectes platessa]
MMVTGPCGFGFEIRGGVWYRALRGGWFAETDPCRTLSAAFELILSGSLKSEPDFNEFLHRDELREGGGNAAGIHEAIVFVIAGNIFPEMNDERSGDITLCCPQTTVQSETQEEDPVTLRSAEALLQMEIKFKRDTVEASEQKTFLLLTNLPGETPASKL